MSDTMIELKPCPFCGSPAHIVEHKFYKLDSNYEVKCMICNARTDSWFDTPKDAAEFWNRRADDETSNA